MKKELVLLQAIRKMHQSFKFQQMADLGLQSDTQQTYAERAESAAFWADKLFARAAQLVWGE